MSFEVLNTCYIVYKVPYTEVLKTTLRGTNYLMLKLTCKYQPEAFTNYFFSNLKKEKELRFWNN
jgi:hypothetical protein